MTGRYLSIKNAIIGADCFHFFSFFALAIPWEKQQQSKHKKKSAQRLIGTFMRNYNLYATWIAYGNENEIEVNFEWVETQKPVCTEKNKNKIKEEGEQKIKSVARSLCFQFESQPPHSAHITYNKNRLFYFFVHSFSILSFTNWLLSHRNHMVKVLHTRTEINAAHTHTNKHSNEWKERYLLTCTNNLKTHWTNL